MLRYQSSKGMFVPMPTRPHFGPNPLFQPVANIVVKLLEFQGAIPDVEVVSPSTNDPVEVLYHFGERIAQALSFCDEVDFTANCFHGLW